MIAFEEPRERRQPQRLDRIAELLTSLTRRGSAQLVVTTHSPGFVAAVLERLVMQRPLRSACSALDAGRTTAIRLLRDFGCGGRRSTALREPDESTDHGAGPARLARGLMACRLALLGEDAAHENVGRALISAARLRRMRRCR
ncbi:MAG: hypothetical protein U0S48_16550 [Solirubrobacteraceae bacterium]